MLQSTAVVWELDESGYFPFYQPIVHLATGIIQGYEVLARTRDIQGNVVSAGPLFFDRSIPSLVQRSIDRYVRQQALTYAAGANEDTFISLNISPDWVDMMDDASPSITIEMIRQSGLDPSRVLIELTETGCHIDKLRRLVREYQKAGVKVAIDDFGAGASQVDRVIALQPDMIKLDMAIFKQAARGSSAADVLLAAGNMVKRAGCQIVVEGVETEQEFHFAIECGATYIQGWLFARAQNAFTERKRTVGQARQLRNSYLTRKVEQLSRAGEHNQTIFEQVRQIAKWLRAQGDSPLDFECLGQDGIRRFYVCNIEGEQVSPNYELVGKDIRQDFHFIGHNWVHRPYFPIIVALHAARRERIVVSDVYRDTSEGDMCKTYGLFVDEACILLVDVLCEDDTLFVS